MHDENKVKKKKPSDFKASARLQTVNVFKLQPERLRMKIICPVIILFSVHPLVYFFSFHVHFKGFITVKKLKCWVFSVHMISAIPFVVWASKQSNTSPFTMEWFFADWKVTLYEWLVGSSFSMATLSS